MIRGLKLSWKNVDNFYVKFKGSWFYIYDKNVAAELFATTKISMFHDKYDLKDTQLSNLQNPSADLL